ncbi:hypothetical protein EV421DRAFT_1680423, partial [Armillaria borealis]
EIPDLTATIPLKRPGPKKKMDVFTLSKEDDVRVCVIHQEVKSGKENAKSYTMAPKIRRLVSYIRRYRPCHLGSVKRTRLKHRKAQKSD